VVTAKSFVTASLIGLVWTAAALADKPTVRISKNGQARAVAALLQRSDFGAGWLGGPIKPRSLTTPDCPGFDPKESDLVVTGHADARYQYKQAGVELDQDVQVLESPSAVRTDFRRSVSARLGRCLAYQLHNVQNISDVSVEQIAFPKTGAVSAVYRAMLVLTRGAAQTRLVTDYVFFGDGPVEYEFTVVAPVAAVDQLSMFESGLAQILIKRAKTLTA
jgi:hypothetical protein